MFSCFSANEPMSAALVSKPNICIASMLAEYNLHICTHLAISLFFLFLGVAPATLEQKTKPTRNKTSTTTHGSLACGPPVDVPVEKMMEPVRYDIINDLFVIFFWTFRSFCNNCCNLFMIWKWYSIWSRYMRETWSWHTCNIHLDVFLKSGCDASHRRVSAGPLAGACTLAGAGPRSLVAAATASQRRPALTRRSQLGTAAPATSAATWMPRVHMDHGLCSIWLKNYTYLFFYLIIHLNSLALCFHFFTTGVCFYGRFILHHHCAFVWDYPLQSLQVLF